MDGEPVDVYLSDLRRLARLAEIEDDGLLRCAFVVGLPTDVSSNLRASVKIKTTPLSVLVEQARTLMSERLAATACVAMQRREQRHGASNDNRYVDISCFKCQERGHIARHCPKNKVFTCFKCGGKGHVSRNCIQGNDKGQLHAPATSPKRQ